MAQAQGERHPRARRYCAGCGSSASPGWSTNTLMPADFPIDEDGRIVETCYGRDAGDRIPMERVEVFVARGLLARGVRVAETA